jgi:FkbM family methyltransferase
VAVAADQDLDPGSSGRGWLLHDMTPDQGDLGAGRRLARPEDHRDRLAGGRLVDVDRQEAMDLLSRTAHVLLDFLVCRENMGLISAIRTVFLAKFHDRLTTVSIKSMGRQFSFRGRADRGAMTHFYRPGYRIEDNENLRVQYIIDAGANIGDETARFRHHHPNAKILAIEVEENNYKILSKNFEKDDGVSTIHKGLWSHPCRLKILSATPDPYRALGDVNLAFFVAEAQHDNFDIEAVSIKNLITEYALPRIDILKVDIEGAELDVFLDCKDWIKLVNVIIFECNDSDKDGAARAVIKSVMDEDFNFFICGECLVMIRTSTGWRLAISANY